MTVWGLRTSNPRPFPNINRLIDTYGVRNENYRREAVLAQSTQVGLARRIVEEQRRWGVRPP